MTYGELYQAFIYEFDDGSGVICATPIELLPALRTFIENYGKDTLIDKDVIRTRLYSMNFNDACVDDVFCCIKN